MCGLTHEDWMIMRAAIEDSHEPHRAAVLSGMTKGHEVDVEVMAHMQRWREALSAPEPAAQIQDMMTYEVMGYSQHLIHPDTRRNKWVTVRKYRATDRMWAYAEIGYVSAFPSD